MRRRLTVLLAALPLAWGLAAAPVAASGTTGPARLTVITTLQKENMRRFKDAFEADNPDIRLAMRTLGNGTVTDILMAQEEVGDIDVIWGLSAASMILLQDAGLLLPYTPLEAERVQPRFKGAGPALGWVGGGIWTTALCAASNLGSRTPVSWTELTGPDWKDQLAMPSPIASGVGLALVAGWIMSMGEERAWAFMDALHENILTYTQEGSKPCRMVATGGIKAGLSLDFRAFVTKEQTGTVTPIFPEGLGWDVSAAAILASTDAPDAARRFADWSASDRARRFYADTLSFSMIADGQVNRAIPDIPADLTDRLAPMDFAWLAANRERILEIWLRRYGGKLEAPLVQ